MSKELTDEEEATWRALKDEAQILKRRCRWGFHRWTIWAHDPDIEAKSDYGGFSSGTVIYYYKSTCADCNLPRWKKIKRPR